MGIKTENNAKAMKALSLKNLPTTWGLRLPNPYRSCRYRWSLKNLPTTWGLRLQRPTRPASRYAL